MLDETFAALDPYSKRLVMDKLSLFCSNSIVLVIFHENGVNDAVKDCVSGMGFFKKNLHVEMGRIVERAVC